jgi:serine/threonine-protein kinase
MGIVYKALDPDIEREVAIKTIRFDTLTEGMEKEDLLTRVIREAKAAGRLNHPNIITIYDVVRDKDLTYIVMQYVDGPSLQTMIDSGKPFSPQEIIDTLKPVSDALDFAHQGGIVHGISSRRTS